MFCGTHCGLPSSEAGPLLRAFLWPSINPSLGTPTFKTLLEIRTLDGPVIEINALIAELCSARRATIEPMFTLARTFVILKVITRGNAGSPPPGMGKSMPFHSNRLELARLP